MLIRNLLIICIGCLTIWVFIYPSKSWSADDDYFPLIGVRGDSPNILYHDLFDPITNIPGNKFRVTGSYGSIQKGIPVFPLEDAIQKALDGARAYGVSGSFHAGIANDWSDEMVDNWHPGSGIRYFKINPHQARPYKGELFNKLSPRLVYVIPSDSKPFAITVGDKEGATTILTHEYWKTHPRLLNSVD